MNLNKFASPLAKPRILCVDDEPQVLAGLADTLRRRFEVMIAGSGEDALARLADSGPFQVIVSDYAMPKMNGAEFLSQARVMVPDTVRILLTGQASLEGAMASVNQGNIFRFLTKPCAPADLVRALEDAVEQARLITADRVLVERKLTAMAGHLVRAEKMASAGSLASALGLELTRVLGLFGGTIHDLEVRQKEAQPPSQEDLEHLEAVRTLLARHADKLLSLSRPSVAQGPGSLALAVRNAVSLLRSAGLLRHVDLRINVPPGELRVGPPQAALDQVVMNLLRNAVDAVAELNAAWIGISVETHLNTRETWLRVQDPGPGIPRALQSFVFEPYYTTKAHGVGLGLFAARQVMNACGGDIWVRSEENGGATFEAKFPPWAREEEV